jgi:recombination protein RecA
MKIGVMFGNPETTTGGNALKFYASVRLDIRRVGSRKIGETVVANRTRVKVVKNKVAAPFRQTEFEILFGQGVHREAELVELGAAHGILEKSGAWYAYNGERVGQGLENSIEFLKANPQVADEIAAALRARMVDASPAATPGDDDEIPEGLDAAS